MTLEELRAITAMASNSNEPLPLSEAGSYQQKVIDAFADWSIDELGIHLVDAYHVLRMRDPDVAMQIGQVIGMHSTSGIVIVGRM